MSYNTLYPSSIDPFDILFQNMLRGTGFKTIQSKIDYPCDIYFNDDVLVFNIPIVGGKAEDIKVIKTDDEVRVSYHRSDKAPEDDITYVSRSVVRRDFELAWKISPKFDLENLQANYQNGLFTIQIPWAKKSLPKEVPVVDLSNLSNKLATGAKTLREEAVSN